MYNLMKYIVGSRKSSQSIRFEWQTGIFRNSYDAYPS